jgi:hypothetical protein
MPSKSKIINNIHIKNVNNVEKKIKRNKKRNLRRKKQKQQKQLFIDNHKNALYNPNAITTQNSSSLGGGIINKPEQSLIPYGGFKNANDAKSTDLTANMTNMLLENEKTLKDYIYHNENRAQYHGDELHRIANGLSNFGDQANDFIDDMANANKHHYNEIKKTNNEINNLYKRVDENDYFNNTYLNKLHERIDENEKFNEFKIISNLNNDYNDNALDDHNLNILNHNFNIVYPDNQKKKDELNNTLNTDSSFSFHETLSQPQDFLKPQKLFQEYDEYTRSPAISSLSSNKSQQKYKKTDWFDNAADEKPILKDSPKSLKYNKTTTDENLNQPQNLFQVDNENLNQPQNLFQVDNENLIQPQNLFQVDNDNFNQQYDFYDTHFNKYKFQSVPMSQLSSLSSSPSSSSASLLPLSLLPLSKKLSPKKETNRVDNTAEDEKPILKESPKQEPKQESQDFVTSYLEVSKEDFNKGKYKKKYISSMNKPQLTYELKNKFNIDLDQSMSNYDARNLLIEKLKNQKFVWVLHK